MRDDGYHLIDAEMVTLDWHDTLTIDPTATGLTADGPFAEGVPLDDSNLVAKALQLVGRTAAVHIHKALPHGGGLGGGSADAAAVLRWAGFDDARRRAAARRRRRRSAWSAAGPGCAASARSSSRCPSEPGRLHAGDPAARGRTPAVYRAWDELGGPRGDGANDLEPAALAAVPRALAALARPHPRGCRAHPMLAGSGATWFLDGHHDLADALPDATVVLTTNLRLNAQRPPADAAAERDLSGHLPLGAGGACAEASSCASSCACACGAS